MRDETAQRSGLGRLTPTRWSFCHRSRKTRLHHSLLRRLRDLRPFRSMTTSCRFNQRRGNPAHGGQLREQPDPRIAAWANRTGVARYHRPPSRSVKACHTLPNDRAEERGGARATQNRIEQIHTGGSERRATPFFRRRERPRNKNHRFQMHCWRVKPSAIWQA